MAAWVAFGRSDGRATNEASTSTEAKIGDFCRNAYGDASGKGKATGTEREKRHLH